MLVFYVIVPVYNAVGYLDNCIGSVMNQSYQNFHIILVDDGSNDGSSQLCDKYDSLDNRVHTIHKKNGGQLSARITGLRYIIKNLPLDEAFLLHLDSDDQLVETALDTLNQIITQKQCDLVFYTMKGIKDEKVIEDIGWTDIYEGIVEDRSKLFSIVLNDNKYNSLCCKAISTTLIPFEKLDIYERYYSVRHGEDMLQSLEFINNSKRAVFIKDRLYIYTFNPESVSRSPQHIKSLLDSTSLQYAWEFVKEQNIWKKGDYRKYLRYCREILQSRILTAVMNCEEDGDVLNIFRIVENNSYYQMLLNNADFKDYILVLLRNHNYSLLLRILKARNRISRIKKRYVNGKF